MFYFLTIFCRDINPDVEFEAYNYNITLLENFKHFLCRIRWVNFNMFKIAKNLKNSFRLAWENSRHLVILPLVSPPNNIWEMSTEIPYGWSITTQIWVVLLIGCAAWEIWFNQSWISALVSQTSFGGETSCRVAKCQLFSQATFRQAFHKFCAAVLSLLPACLPLS